VHTQLAWHKSLRALRLAASELQTVVEEGAVEPHMHLKAVVEKSDEINAYNKRDH
jgi:hypothetical protein